MVNKILVVEDDSALQEYLKDLLNDAGFTVEIAEDGALALSLIKKSKPNLVILDLGLPKVSGEAVCAEIKKKYAEIPVIILTAKGQTEDVIHGLNLGADDYLAKPFDGNELIARIHARLRDTADTKLRVADLELDRSTLEIKRGTKQINLTPTEFKLLEYLMSNKGRVLSREMILNRIWLTSPDIETRVVDVYMGYLRKKIDAGSEKPLIHSMRGFGYVIKE
ncbi:MAG TPA: response regulator transcription factor [Patescibacteria group bacterium]|nr:response regulator transcription factor [Patescibacteria group bacterium]